MSKVRALFFKSSCSINAVFLWDLPCQRRNHQGVRSIVVLFTKSLFSVMNKWLSTFGATARQKVEIGQSQVRVTMPDVSYAKETQKTQESKKKHVRNKCTRAALLLCLLRGFNYMRLYTTKLLACTLVLGVLLMYASTSVVLSVLSRMRSCALLVFFPMQLCKMGLGPRTGTRSDPLADHCRSPLPRGFPCSCTASTFTGSYTPYLHAL